MKRLLEFCIGLSFGLGLLLSGMTDPGKVLGFLDLAGNWDPSLLFVMGGAVGVGLVGFGWARRRSLNLLGGPMCLPQSRAIDKPLVLGSLLFGAGWGLAGICPGPGLVSAASGQPKALAFLLTMVAGMLLFEFAQSRTRARTAATGEGVE